MMIVCGYFIVLFVLVASATKRPTVTVSTARMQWPEERSQRETN